MNKRQKTLSILIPVYNEEKTIKEVLRRVLKVKTPNFQKELIVVNDGSSDETVRHLKTYPKSKDSTIKIFHHTKNKGKGAAIKTCISKATGDILIIQDGDLELTPQDYPKILNKFSNSRTQVVYGSRFHPDKRNKGVPSLTLFGNKFLTVITNILFGCHLTDMSTAYKAFTKDAIKTIVLVKKGFEVDAEITAKLLKKGYMISEVGISYFPRSIKEGKKLRFKDALQIILTLIICRFSSR